jgi:hypothetical protein
MHTLLRSIANHFRRRRIVDALCDQFHDAFCTHQWQLAENLHARIQRIQRL